MEVKRSEANPHVAMINIRVRVMEKLPSGELTGESVHAVDKIIQVEGTDKFVCIQRLNELLEKMK